MHFSHESVPLSENEFVIVRNLIRERIGLNYEDGKRELLADKLSARVLDCGFQSFIDYYYLLKYGPGENEEWLNVMDALSVQETYFWREMDQIRALVDVIVPQLYATNKFESLRIWSAACATGEEPLTIAMALNEAGWPRRMRIRIHATDASRAALERARLGVYRERSFRALPPDLRDKYFFKLAGAWQVDPELHSQVDYAMANLTSATDVDRVPSAAIVFCRNVFIYFSPAAIAKTVHSFAEKMPAAGYLFVGVSESLLRLTSEFDLLEVGKAFVYVKRGSPV